MRWSRRASRGSVRRRGRRRGRSKATTPRWPRRCATSPAPRVGFRPDPTSDLARALGIATTGEGTVELGIDALAVVADDRELFAVNMVVVGTAPDRAGWFTGAPDLRVEVDGRAVHDGPATSVVVASGQYLRGHDVVPRGHPGDGRAEVQVYAVPRGQRAGVRSRLPQGVHLPHPGHHPDHRTAGHGGRRHGARSASRSTGSPARRRRRITVEIVPEAFLIVV